MSDPEPDRDRPERAEAIRERYRQVFATVPAGIERRIAVAEATGRLEAVEVIEQLRRALLAGNPLEARVQQLVHFAQLVALGREAPARLHARGALRAGAELGDLVGVAETSLVTAGMPAYALAIDIVSELMGQPAAADAAAPSRLGGEEPVIAAGRMWDQRFAVEEWPTEPDSLLVELTATLPPGRGLDLASGPGRNGLWLAAAGWQMTLLDASQVALGQAAERAARDGLDIETVHADATTWEPDGAIFDLVVVANLHPGIEALAAVLASAARALVPGGHLFVVGLDLRNHGRHGPSDPDRLLSVERLARALPPSVTAERLEARARTAERGGEPDEHGPEIAVFAWATRNPA